MTATSPDRGYTLDLSISSGLNLGGLVFDLPSTSAGTSAAHIAGPADNPANSGAIANTGTEGDTAVAGAIARGTYNVDGTGIRIGILSDSFDLLHGEAADITAGALPAAGVTILKEGPSGEDEGRAMAQLIHAIAPGAQIYFYSAFHSEADFAQGIETLAQAGCNIIVDDVSYFDEPFYQDGGLLQRAVQAVVRTGVSYFTSASNSGHNFYEADFVPMAATLPGGIGAVATAQQFSDGSALQRVTIAGGATISIALQWDQPFHSIGNNIGSANSLSIYLFDASDKLVASSTQSAVHDDPVQEFDFTNLGSTADYRIAIVWDGGATPPGLLKYIVYAASAGAIVIHDSNAGIGSGTVTGHELIPEANTVGAVRAAQTPAYGVVPPVLEGFSSVGPGNIIFDAFGNRLAIPVNPGKIDFTAPDGIATSVFNPFYGTSAAAPDAAAVAALVLQANINLTPVQLSLVLAQTAIAMGGPASDVGAGLVQADNAVALALGAIWATPVSGNWNDGSAWALGLAPVAGQFATLSNDQGTIAANTIVTIDDGAALAETVLLTGNATRSIALSLAATGRLTVGGGATIGRNASLLVAGGGSLDVGGIAELTGAGAALTLQPNAAMTAEVIEIGAGTITIGAAATAVATGSIEILLTVGTSTLSIPYGLLMGGGALHLAAGGTLSLSGGGGVFLGGGTLAIDAGARLADLSSGGVAMVVLGAVVTAAGNLDETGHNLLVNTGGSLTVTGSGALQAAGIDVQGTGAQLTVNGTATASAALTGAANGLVTVFGTLVIGAGLSGAAITLVAGSRLILTTASSAVLTSGLTSLITLQGITAAAIDLATIAFDVHNTLTYAAGVLTLASGAVTLARLAFTGARYAFAQSNDGGGHALISVACYARGTRIAIPGGETAIEALRIGDAVLTHGGAIRPICWIGRRSYSATETAVDRSARPIRISAGALGPGLPRRDLLVSPEHAVLLHDPRSGPVLVPARLLVNGGSIRRQPGGKPVEYIHLELATHDVLLAEGQPAESFLDDAGRAMFDNANSLDAPQQGAPCLPDHFCFPRIEAGAVLARLRAGIDARGELAAGPLEGFLDDVRPGLVAGWAHDPWQPQNPVLLDLLCNGIFVATVLADRHRGDLTDVNAAGGYCGFQFRPEQPISPAQQCGLRLSRAGDGEILRRLLPLHRQSPRGTCL